MAPSKSTIVAIIDDNRLVREALTSMLNKLDDIRAVAFPVADSAFLVAEKPDVLLLDVGLRDRTVCVWQHHLRRNFRTQ